MISTLNPLIARLDPAESAITARSIVQSIGRRSDAFARSDLAKVLMSFSGRLGLADSKAISQSIAQAIGRETDAMVQLSLNNARVSLTGRTSEAMEPDPRQLTSQELVELLKMPTCLGATRRAILDQLGDIHGRRFFNHWEFVRFAREKGLKLDFTSPPRRPDPKASLGWLLDDRPGALNMEVLASIMPQGGGREFEEGLPMSLLTVEGIYKDGKIELSGLPGTIPSPARVLVTFLPAGVQADREELKRRAFAKMREGIDLGDLLIRAARRSMTDSAECGRSLVGTDGPPVP